MTRFIDQLLKPAYNEYSDLIKHIKKGTLTFEKFEILIRIQASLNIGLKINPQWKDLIRTVMKLDQFDQGLVEQRIRQCDLYLKLNNIHKIVSVLIEIKDKNALEKDYQTLEDLHKSVFDFVLFNLIYN